MISLATEGEVTRLSGRRMVTLASCALVTPILYFVFVSHYGVNFMFWDEWVTVPMLHAAIHGHLTWSQVWAQHNQNRMLFPNLVFIVFARAGHFDTKSIMYLSATLFSISYLLFLLLYRMYARQWLGPLATLVFGAVWFSFVDSENALWGFQFAWYLIILCAMAMVFSLSWRRVTPFSFSAAMVLAIIASYSSLQGLILWPMGLLILAWRIRDRRRVTRFGGIWLAAGLVVSALYFVGFDFQPGVGGGSTTFALHHPMDMIKYFLANAGNVIPGNVGPGPHEVIGLALILIALFVFYKSCAEKPVDRGTPLPAVLILYAVLFDLLISLGRVSSGVAQALASRYTMANLLLVLGIAVYLVCLLPPPDCLIRSLLDPNGNDTGGARVKPWHVVVGGVLAVFLLVQIMASTTIGIQSASITEKSRVKGARVVVNLSKISLPEQSLFVSSYVFPSLKGIEPLVKEAEADQLNVFAPGPLEQYEAEGPPCRALHPTQLALCRHGGGPQHGGG